MNRLEVGIDLTKSNRSLSTLGWDILLKIFELSSNSWAHFTLRMLI